MYMKNSIAIRNQFANTLKCKVCQYKSFKLLTSAI